jgi:hypothetical protein
MKLKSFGFFQEMPDAEAIEFLRGHKADEPRPNEEKILRYLRNGRELMAMTGLGRDLLSDSQQIIGPLMVFTDGEWAWTSDLIYYVHKYHIDVDADFIRRMEEKGWRTPPVPNPEDLQLEGWHT